MMKKLTVLLGIFAIAALVSVSAQAGEGGCQCPMMVKGAKVEVKNVDNGITVTITATEAAAVKEIQDKGAKISASGGCPMMKDGKCPMAKEGGCSKMKEGGCQKTKDGKCPMMQQQNAPAETPPAAAPAPEKK